MSTDGHCDSARGEAEALISEHEGTLLRYAVRILGDNCIAQDAVEEVFLRLFADKDWKIVAACGDLDARLYRNVHEASARRIAPRVAATRGNVPGPCEQAVESIRALPPGAQQMIVLKILEGRSNLEISRITGMNEATVAASLSLSIRKVATELKKGGIALNETTTEGQTRPEKKLMKCEDVQPLLFDYMSRELGEGRTVAVREHIRKCKSCQALARDIQATLDLLRTVSKAVPGPEGHLTDSRRRRIIRAFTHPLMSWVEKHLLLTSVVAAVIVVTIVVNFMGHLIEKRTEPLIGDPVSVRILAPGQTNFLQGTNLVEPAGR